MDKPRLGIIGCGRIATIAHAPALRQLEVQNRCELVACCDANAQAAHWFGRQFGIRSVYTDVADLIARGDVDAVAVATPPSTHMEITIACLQAGKHVMCEKPMAMNAGQARAMVDAARTSGCILLVGYGSRFAPSARSIRRHIRAGDLGAIYYGRAAVLRQRGVPTRSGFTSKRVSGGGVLVDIGVHVLDLAMWLMGMPRPIGVYGVTSTKLALDPEIAAHNSTGAYDTASFDVEDLCVALVRFENGASLMLEASWVLNQAEAQVTRTQVFGTLGSASTSPLRILVRRGGGLNDVTPTTIGNGSRGDEGTIGNLLKLGHFVDCISGRASPLVTLDEALQVQRVIDGVYDSAVRNVAVDLRE